VWKGADKDAPYLTQATKELPRYVSPQLKGDLSGPG
jgi:hypothetical protein